MRDPEYVTSAVNSIVFTQTLSGNVTLATPTVTIMTIGGAHCVTSANAQTCSTTLSAPLGQDQWTVDTYASTTGSGTPLSIGVLPFTILGGVGNTASLTLSPAVNSIAFVPVSGSCNAVTACTTAVALQAYDATGATIIGATPFVSTSGSALTINLGTVSSLTAQNSAGAAAATAMTYASAMNLSQIMYDGTSSGSKTLTATAGSLSASFTLMLASGTITSSSGDALAIGINGTTTATLPASETGFAGSFSETSSNCTGVVTIGSVSNSGSPASFPVVQSGAGICTVLISDGQGGSTSVTITSTTFGVSIN